MIDKEKFKHFVNELTSSDIEMIKKETSSSGRVLLVLGIVFFILGIITMLDGYVFSFIIGVVLIVSNVATNYKKALKKREYRDKYINKVLEYLLDGYEYNFDILGQIDESVFNDSQFVSDYDIYEGSDKLSISIPNDDGSSSSTYLTLCDLTVKRIEYREVDDSFGSNGKFNSHHRRTRRERVEVSVYSGVFGYVNFPFEFKCVLGLNNKYRKKGMLLEKVVLEDMEFHKKYGVYSNDQIEARYILTPDMMEKLLGLYSVYKGIRLILVDSKMYFSLPSKNLFELRTYKGDNTTLFDGIYDDISNILSIVEEIKNNNKIFKM